MTEKGGANVLKATPLKDLALQAKQLYAKTFPADQNDNPPAGPVKLTYACAPGRVNLIGEHTDYCEGFVFPMAIDLSTIVVGALNGTDSTVNILSGNVEAPDVPLVQFECRDVEKVTEADSSIKWSNYVRGVVNHFHNPSVLKGFNAVVLSTVPIGGGLSSSASLEVSMYTFLEELFIDPATSQEDKAKRCQKAEHTYADMPCGIMDQLISTTGKLGHATLIDCDNLDVNHISIPDPDIAILIINSNKKHQLSGSEYPERRNACFDAAAACQKPSLRHATLQDITDADDKLTECQKQRARHVINEINRTNKASEALAIGDYEKFGQFMNESHNSLRDLFEVSTPELDELVDLARQCPGVYGSRMTGGGFGGCTVTLVEHEHHQKVIEKIHAEYSGNATFFLASPSEGSRVLYYD